ncbi:putative nucleotide pyrophosphohydrolase [Xanthomonas phage Elanor]|uniref:Nucleotide pyrophosphohydrolase n=1 Tax=Xanthomonas phage Elanor TaxID=2939127 RepID=A0A9E7J5B9_9CAUD|nr:putative nucleotide pyrophosphohydrolase [Xanthomonas phage Elanor]URA07045.1 putative nucleotide pyrophosphohydrolase [Xanthomonas phage Elanor]
MSRIPSQTLVVVPYDQMVRNLFKPMPTKQLCAVHAAIGLAGEVAELIVTNSIEHVVDEMGDVEFYVEAAYQVIGGRIQPGEELYVEANEPASNQVLGTVTIALSTSAGRLLDLTKKAWVYDQDLNERAIRYELMRIEVMLGCLRDLVGIRRPDVLGANQAKLGKRYPEGVYTNRDAQLSVDKSGEHDVD